MNTKVAMPAPESSSRASRRRDAGGAPGSIREESSSEVVERLRPTETFTSPSSPPKDRSTSMSRRTRSDLVRAMSESPELASSSRQALVSPRDCSSGCQASVTLASITRPDFLRRSWRARTSATFAFTSTKVPHGSGWAVKRFMNEA
jgi:hypothetical protein